MRDVSLRSLVLIFCTVWMCPAHVHAVDMDSVDAEVEESMADSDAVARQTKLTRDEARKEAQENSREQRIANQRKAAADAKKRDAGKDPARKEAEISRLQKEKARAIQEQKLANAQIAKQEQILKVSQAKLQKMRGELEAVKQLRAEQKKKLSEM